MRSGERRLPFCIGCGRAALRMASFAHARSNHGSELDPRLAACGSDRLVPDRLRAAGVADRQVEQQRNGRDAAALSGAAVRSGDPAAQLVPVQRRASRPYGKGCRYHHHVLFHGLPPGDRRAYGAGRLRDPAGSAACVAGPDLPLHEPFAAAADPAI